MEEGGREGGRGMEEGGREGGGWRKEGRKEGGREDLHYGGIINCTYNNYIYIYIYIPLPSPVQPPTFPVLPLAL